MNNPATWVDAAIAFTFPLTLIVILWERLKHGKSPGVRTIQFTAVAMIIPAVVLLALRGLLQGEAVAAIIGGIAGYLLANVAKFDDRDRE